MNKEIRQNDDFVAGMIRSQIGSWQDLLYCLENDLVDGEHLLESIKTLERKNRRMIGLCEQIRKLDSALLSQAEYLTFS